MSDTVKVNLEENSKYRVAFELMQVIASKENTSPPTVKRDREYYLRLYRQTYDCVHGYQSIDEVVEGSRASAGMGFSY